MWWIPGNHDTDQVHHYDNVFGSTLDDHNLHGRVVDIAGVRIAGLGGVFREKIWNPWKTEPAFASQADYLAHCGAGNRWRGDCRCGTGLRSSRQIWRLSEAYPPMSWLRMRGPICIYMVVRRCPNWRRTCG